MTGSGGEHERHRAHARTWLIREHYAASQTSASVTSYSGWRCEGLSLLYDIGDENPGLGVARLTTSMRRFGRYLECIAGFERAGRLTLYGKLEAAFQDIGGFDSRMRVPPDGHSRLYRRFHK